MLRRLIPLLFTVAGFPLLSLLAAPELSLAAPCSPRPRIDVRVTRDGTARLQADIAVTTAADTPTNALRSLRFLSTPGALVDISGGPSGVAAPFDFTPPSGLTQVRLTIRQTSPGQAATVRLEVTDDCGPWATMVGGGGDAFREATPTPTPTSTATPTATATPTVTATATATATLPTDARGKPAVFSAGSWQLRVAFSAGPPDATFTYGTSGLIPLMCDWDGSGSRTPGLFDPSTATWSLRNSNSAGAPDLVFVFGTPGWTPVCGDWDGSGTETVGVFNPGTATWGLRNSNSAGPPDLTLVFGTQGWTPVVGDWDGDGDTTVGAFDPSTATWYLRNSNSTGGADLSFAFGFVNWLPVRGDWDGNGVETIGVFDPSSGIWYVRDSNSAGAASVAPFVFGSAGMTPVTWR